MPRWRPELETEYAELGARLAQVQLPAGAGVEQAVAVSPDGRWWVLAGVQGRTLWRREQPRSGPARPG